MTPSNSSVITRRWDRRTLLRGAGLTAIGLTGAALLGCFGDDDDDPMDDEMMAEETPTEEMMASPTATGMADDMSDDDMSGDDAADAMLGDPREFELIGGWFRNEEARYYDFGMTSPVQGSTVSVAPIYVLITGMDSAGDPIPVEGQHNIVDVVPGDVGYSDLWEVMLVTVEADYEADSIRSKGDIDAAGLDVAPAGVMVNCPIVPAGSTFEDGTQLVQGWYQGERVYYPDFGPNPPVAIPIWAFATGTGADGMPQLVEGQHNIIDAIPGRDGYSAFWRVMLVMVDDMYVPDTMRSASDVAASGFEVVTTDTVVNCPVVSPLA